MRARIPRLVLLCLLQLIACDRPPTAPRGSAAPSFEISDATHNGGNAHFYLLPPLVPQPSFSGAFDPSQSPVVEVCEWDNTCRALIERYTMSNGAGGAHITLEDQQYHVDWDTRVCLSGACTLDVTKVYRLRVLVGGVQLGFADVDAVANGSQLKNLQTGEYIGLVNGRTLPVKFRIEVGAVSVIAPGGTVAIGATGGNVSTSDGAVALAIPAGAVSATTAISAATPTDAPPLPLDGPSIAPVTSLGPDGTTFSTPVTLTLRYQFDNLPPGVPASALHLVTWDGSGWQVVPGATVDSAASTVRAAISHFSYYTLSIFPNGVRAPTGEALVEAATSTSFTGFSWAYNTYPVQSCGWSGSWPNQQYVCYTYTQSYSYPLSGMPISWSTLAPGIATVAAGPTYTNAQGVAQSPPVLGKIPGATTLVASTYGASGSYRLSVLGRLGLLPRTARNVAGWSVRQQITQTVAWGNPVSVSLLNRNGFLTIGEPGTANYTYGGGTGTYVLPANALSKDLIAAGLAGVGTDTLVASAPGFIPDTAVITLVKGYFTLSGLPASLALGDSAAVQVTVVDSAGGLGNLAYPITVGLSGVGLAFSNGQAPITSVGVAQRTSNTFYVKATAVGQQSVTLTHPDYVSLVRPMTVQPPPNPPVIAPSVNALTIQVQQGAVNQGQIIINNGGGGTLSGLSAGSFSNYFNGSATPWVTASLNTTTAPATITITAAPGMNIPAGAYQLRFDVSAPGASNSPYTFYSINITVVAAGVTPVNATISPNVSSVSISVPAGQSRTAQIQIANAGTDPLTNLSAGPFSNYFNGSPAPWVTASFNTTTAPATLTITASPDVNAAQGTQQLRFDVLSPGATNSPYTFYSINVTVTPPVAPPQLAVGGKSVCARRSDQTVACWGETSFGATAASSGQFTTIGGGFFHYCGIRPDQTLNCWGYNSDNRATPPAGAFTSISVAPEDNCALRVDGTPVCWGYTNDGRAAIPAGTYKQIGLGWYHGCAIRTDDTMACWGRNDFGQATAPSGTFLSVSGGQTHTCAIRTDQTLVCFGDSPAPPSGTFVQLSAASAGGHTCAVRSDQTLACWGNQFGQLTPPSGRFIQVSVNYQQSCAVRTDHTIVCWGSNATGALDVPPEFTTP